MLTLLKNKPFVSSFYRPLDEAEKPARPVYKMLSSCFMTSAESPEHTVNNLRDFLRNQTGCVDNVKQTVETWRKRPPSIRYHGDRVVSDVQTSCVRDVRF